MYIACMIPGCVYAQGPIEAYVEDNPWDNRMCISVYPTAVQGYVPAPGSGRNPQTDHSLSYHSKSFTM